MSDLLFEMMPQRKMRYKFTCFSPCGDSDNISEPEFEVYGGNVCSIKEFEETKKVSNKNYCGNTEEVLLKCCEEITISKDLVQEEQKVEIIEAAGKPKQKIQQEDRAKDSKVVEEEKVVDEELLIRTGFRPRDSTNPLIYSITLGVGPNSYITRDPRFIENCPPPVYLSKEEIMMLTKTKKEEFLKGCEIPEEGGLHCIDEEAMKKQSGVMLELLKQFITSFNIRRVSLPARIFEPRSTVERIVDLWRFAPIYLTNAAKTRDKVNRMKLVVAFAVSGMYLSAQQMKPFNPIIGETLEGSFEDGTQIFVEHILHHPTTSIFLMQNNKAGYRMHGHYFYNVNMSGNTLEGQQEGPNIIEFPNDEKIIFRYPKIKVHGMLFSQRMIYPSGMMTFEDPKNSIKACVVFNHGKGRGWFGSRIPGTKIDDFEGLIYYARKNAKIAGTATQVKELKDVDRPIGQISGSWLNFLKIAGGRFWDINKVQPSVLHFKDNPLPSDWRYREDLIWLRRGNVDIAQEWKIRIEAEQRKDEQLRKIDS